MSFPAKKYKYSNSLPPRVVSPQEGFWSAIGSLKHPKVRLLLALFPVLLAGVFRLLQSGRQRK